MFIYHAYCKQIINKHISGMSQALFRYILPISYQASGISWEYFGPLWTHRYFYSFEMTSVINQISLDISILLIHTEIFAADAGSCLFQTLRRGVWGSNGICAVCNIVEFSTSENKWDSVALWLYYFRKIGILVWWADGLKYCLFCLMRLGREGEPSGMISMCTGPWLKEPIRMDKPMSKITIKV